MRRATGARIEAAGLALRTREGPAYSGVTFTALPGSVTAFRADSGGGRTALLLTLAGRMRPTSGELHVDGHSLPGASGRVRRIAALGLLDGVNDLDGRLRVREHINERLHLRLRAGGRALLDAALTDAGLADLDTTRLVRDLSMPERRRLGVALALLDEPRLLLVDNVDGGLSGEHQAELWQTLRALADSGPTTIATCADAAAAEGCATVIPITRSTAEPTRRAPERHRARLRLSELFGHRDSDTERAINPATAAATEEAEDADSTDDTVGALEAADAVDTDDTRDAGGDAGPGDDPQAREGRA